MHLDSGSDRKIISLDEPHKIKRTMPHLSLFPCFVQSLQTKRWISSTVWTTVARQPPTRTTLPRRAPLAPPTLLPTHTCTHTLTRINTLPLCQPPARTRLPKHTGPTGTHTSSASSSISSIYRHPFNIPFALSSLFFCSFTLSFLIIKVRETQWHVQGCLFFISVPFMFSLSFTILGPFSHQLMGSFKWSCFLDCTALISQLRDTWNKN